MAILGKFYSIVLQDSNGKQVLEQTVQLPLPLPDMVFFTSPEKVKKYYVRIGIQNLKITFKETSGCLDIDGEITSLRRW